MTGWRARHSYLVAATVILFFAGYAVLFLTGAGTIRHLVDNLVAGYLMAWGLYAMLSDVSRAEVGKRFILTTVAIASCFVIAEGGVLLGVADYRSVFGTFDIKHALSVAGRRFDPELQWVHDPYYEFEADYQGNLGRGMCIPPDPSRRIKIQYDQNGFRNSREMTGAEVVVIGDSYVEAAMTPDAALVTSVLARLQGKRVANLGSSGYGPPQELGVLKRYGFSFNPDTVIWAFYEGNDVSDMKEYEKKLTTLSGESAFWQDFWFRSLSRNLLALYFRSTIRECVPSRRIKPYRAKFTDSAEAVSPVFFAPPDDVDSFHSEDELRRAASYIAEAARLCRERNIRFIVAFVPDKYRVYAGLSNVALITEELRSWKLDDSPARLERILAAMISGLEYLDLTLALKSESRRGVPTYLSDDTHWSVEGHRVVAEALHLAIESPALGGPVQKARR
jgi:SGNH hydrolase-like domain, acetyltransferase AlgX